MQLDTLAAKADFYLTLSRAFLPPTSPNSHEAFVSLLPEELAEIADEAGYSVAAELADYRSSCAAVPDQISLLQLYSALFLVPPREVQLHVSVYLDGSILGASSDALQAFFRKHGMAAADDFHDLPDHLSAALEFLALLYARAAESSGEARAELLRDAVELNRKFLLSWVPVMRRQMRRVIDQNMTEGNPNDPLAPLFLHLTAILQSALTTDAGPLDETLRRVIDPVTTPEVPGEDKHDMALCKSCGAEIAPAARIRRVRKVLEKEGIDTAHLELCPKCRGMDMTTLGGQAGSAPGQP